VPETRSGTLLVENVPGANETAPELLRTRKQTHVDKGNLGEETRRRVVVARTLVLAPRSAVRNFVFELFFSTFQVNDNESSCPNNETIR
jgi:hypothetical protein